MYSTTRIVPATAETFGYKLGFAFLLKLWLCLGYMQGFLPDLFA